MEFAVDSIDAVRLDWGGPLGVYAHSSTEIDKRWVFEDVISPQNMPRLLMAGGRRLSPIGGCCGIGAAHIHEL